MEPDLEAAAAWVRSRLESQLPDRLTYHRPAHTADDVVPAAGRLADTAGLDAHERLLLITAAWFHDLGFIVRAEGHEEIGIAMAARELPALGYAPPDVDVVATLIRATRLPQTPETHLAGLLADADLDVLGREDFPERNDALRREMAASGAIHDDLAWLDEQVRFLAGHRYHTVVARELRDEGKARNLARLRARLAEAGGVDAGRFDAGRFYGA
jgi:uncharacterized protein